MAIFDITFIGFILYCIILFIAGCLKQPASRAWKYLKQLLSKLRLALFGEHTTLESQRLKLQKTLMESEGA
jgi:hypothetical protein